ncbi:MAG: DUF4276 family protein [Spirochaetaceae bacterium]|jgi:hypothetical protein|nr:DUF4276 family protein [Spirochaetaceae bacterium]
MKHSPKPKIGIITEDKTDADCVKILVKRISNDRVVSKGMGVGGGGNMFNVKKMTRFTQSLFAAGCTHLLVVHDLDRNRTTNELNDEKQLRVRLENALIHNPITRKTIIVPIEELEAWLLSDQYPHPQTISNPKNELRKLNCNYRTSDNAKIAGKINIDDITQKCPSFIPLQEFLKSIA